MVEGWSGESFGRFCESTLFGGLESKRQEGLYFWQKQKEAKSLFWVLRTEIFHLDSAIRRI